MVTSLPLLPLTAAAASSAFCPPVRRSLLPRTPPSPRPQPPSRTTLLHQYSPAAASVVVDVSEDAPRDVASLSAWAAGCGAQTSDCLEIAPGGGDDGGAGSRAVATRAASAGEPLVCVPADLMLTGGKARAEVGTEAMRAEQTLMLSDHSSFYLFLKVLREYELGEQSPWYYYLNSLPRYYSNGASMTDFCFGCLPPYAAGQAQEEKNRLKRYELALNEITFLTDATKTNSDLIQWAYNVVHTRYQELPGGDYALIPVADMFDHGGANANAYITYDDEGNCYAYSSQDVPAGQPLTICYGDPTNPSKLLARYGFLDESSAATFCKWIAEEPSSELYQLGYPGRMLFFNDGGVSNEVWDCLLYQELGQSNPNEQAAFYQACAGGDEATKGGYHQQYFSQTLSALRGHVTYILSELDALDAWRESNYDVVRHPRLPLIGRHNEFVKRIFQLVQQNLDNMG